MLYPHHLPIPGLIRHLRSSLHRFDSTAGSEGHGLPVKFSAVFFPHQRQGFLRWFSAKKTILKGGSDGSDGLSMFKSKWRKLKGSAIKVSSCQINGERWCCLTKIIDYWVGDVTSLGGSTKRNTKLPRCSWTGNERTCMGWKDEESQSYIYIYITINRKWFNGATLEPA